jgi:REP element-mobilizing transposase RayT
MPVVGVLTFPAYGTRLPRFGHGRREWLEPAGEGLIEPDPVASAAAHASAAWPPVELDPAQRSLILSDLHRIAALRGFRLLGAVAAADHVHVLMAIDTGTPLLRLFQLVKGALARILSVAAGDEPPRRASGNPARHHKWWARQYVFQRIRDEAGLATAVSALAAHAEAGAAAELPVEPPRWDSGLGPSSPGDG